MDLNSKSLSVFEKMLQMIECNEYTHILMVPWLKHGGMDLGAIHFANALAIEYEKSVLMISTENTDSPWGHLLDDKVRFIEIGPIISELGEDEQESVFMKVLEEKAPEVVHIINSNLAWSSICKYSDAIDNKTRIYASLVCKDFTEDGEPIGYASKYIQGCHDVLTGVMCDTKWFPKLLSREYGTPPAKIHTVYFPTQVPDNFPVNRQKNDSSLVLWASRLDRQKRPEYLCEIARMTPDINYLVYGLSVFESDEKYIQMFSKLDNIEYKGAFSNLSELPLSEISCFLYTSAWDGLPLILLDMASQGVPIVAPSVGGIPEFVDSETGYLVKDPDDIEEYIDALYRIRENGEEALGKAKKAYKLVVKSHSPSAFVRSLSLIDSYV